MEPGAAVPSPVSSYREFAPHPALRGLVRAFFSFAPYASPRVDRSPTFELTFGARASFFTDSPQFADAGASIVWELGRVWENGSRWSSASATRAHVIGPMTRAGSAGGEAVPEMIGVFLRPGVTEALTHAPAHEVTDRIVALESLWGGASRPVGDRLAPLPEGARVDLLESLLLREVIAIRDADTRVDVAALASWIVRQRGVTTVEELARHAGVSRQHLGRVFRRRVGMSPKRFCRLARFHAALAFTRPDVDWARAAAELGYADQSHLIADFRAFSGLTPQRLASDGKRHPFIELSRARQWSRSVSG